MAASLWTYSLFAVLLTAADSRVIDQDHKYDTIVIGLGAAGTTAASVLARGGRQVLALEAMERVGGRVYTQTFGDGVVEVGGEWIHGQHPSLVYDAAVKNNVTVIEQAFEIEVLGSDGRTTDPVVKELLDLVLEIVEEGSNKTESVGDYTTKKLMEYIREKRPEILNDKQLIDSLLRLANLMTISNDASDDWKNLNAATGYKHIDGCLTTSWHTHGYKTFFDILLNKYKDGPGLPSLDIKLSTEVTQISWPADPQQPVIVTCRDGSAYSADTAIVTVSLGVLKASHSTLFSPPLPAEKVKAIETIAFGLIGKIILSFPQAWWQSGVMDAFLWRSFDGIPSDDMWTTWVVGMSAPAGSSNTLTLWLAGDMIKLIETLSDDVVKTKSVELLRRFNANTTIPEPTGIIRSKWFSNPFTRGTYSYDSLAAASLPGARGSLAAPLTDSAGRARVLFAGEATHQHHFGTVHGAAETGNREAQRILNQTSAS